MAARQLSDPELTDVLKRARTSAQEGQNDETAKRRRYDSTSCSDSISLPESEEEELRELGINRDHRMIGNPITALSSMGSMDLTPAIEQYQVPDNCVGLIIGRGGESITGIQNNSGCRIQISQSSYQDPNCRTMRNCTLTGTPSAIKKAKGLMEAVIMKAKESRPSSRFAASNGSSTQSGTHSPVVFPPSSADGKMVTIELMIPGSKCGLVIGKRGETIKSIQERAGVKMVMIQESNQVSSTPKPLRIVGAHDKVEFAKALVNDIVQSKDDRLPMYNTFGGAVQNKSMGEVIVPRSAVGVIIGRNGEAIKRLTQETGARIQFKVGEDHNAPERTAVITGTRAQIEKATQLITDLVSRSAAIATDVFRMHVPADKTGLVIGKGGETVKQIARDSGARVELSREPPPNDHEKVFIIRGTPQQIVHASHLIGIRAGDIPPGTPVPSFPNGVAEQQSGSSYLCYGANTDQSSAAWTGAYYAQYCPPNAGVAYANSYPLNFVPVVAAEPEMTKAVPGSVPDPPAGRADYSAQWAEYYRLLGLPEQAEMIERQARDYHLNGGYQQALSPALPGPVYSQNQPQYGYVQQSSGPYQYAQQY